MKEIKLLESLTGKKVILKEELSAEELLSHKKTQQQLKDLGDKQDIKNWIERFHVKTVNYKPDTYYRVESGSGRGYGGVGKGLYLGRDKQALINFYDLEGEDLPVSEYFGSPKWMDLTEQSKFDKFKKMLIKQGVDIVNSDKIGKIVTDLGYDGIRYYDPFATGEEFVLFNVDKFKKIK